MILQVNRTLTRMIPTPLRFNSYYVLWYMNVARLVVTGVIPFVSLTYLNSRIYKVIRRRRRMTNRPRAAPSAAQKAEEGRQAIVLLVIVVLFLICHTLRIILNIHGLFTLNYVRRSMAKGCAGVTGLWTLIGASISHILLTINSSINFIIYCFMSTTFRGILYRWVNNFIGRELLTVRNNNNRQNDNKTQADVDDGGENGHEAKAAEEGSTTSSYVGGKKRPEAYPLMDKGNGASKSPISQMPSCRIAGAYRACPIYRHRFSGTPKDPNWSLTL